MFLQDSSSGYGYLSEGNSGIDKGDPLNHWQGQAGITIAWRQRGRERMMKELGGQWRREEAYGLWLG